MDGVLMTTIEILFEKHVGGVLICNTRTITTVHLVHVTVHCFYLASRYFLGEKPNPRVPQLSACCDLSPRLSGLCNFLFICTFTSSYSTRMTGSTLYTVITAIPRYTWSICKTSGRSATGIVKENWSRWLLTVLNPWGVKICSLVTHWIVSWRFKQRFIHKRRWELRSKILLFGWTSSLALPRSVTAFKLFWFATLEFNVWRNGRGTIKKQRSCSPLTAIFFFHPRRIKFPAWFFLFTGHSSCAK